MILRFSKPAISNTSLSSGSGQNGARSGGLTSRSPGIGARSLSRRSDRGTAETESPTPIHVSDVKLEDQDSVSSVADSPVKLTSSPVKVTSSAALEGDLFAPSGIGAEELMREFERRSPSVSGELILPYTNLFWNYFGIWNNHNTLYHYGVTMSLYVTCKRECNYLRSCTLAITRYDASLSRHALS
eukprot:sb/3471371/